MEHGTDRIRLLAYVAVALAGMLAGMILCRLAGSASPPGPAQGHPVPHPRSLDG